MELGWAGQAVQIHSGGLGRGLPRPHVVGQSQGMEKARGQSGIALHCVRPFLKHQRTGSHLADGIPGDHQMGIRPWPESLRLSLPGKDQAIRGGVTSAKVGSTERW